MPVDVTALVDSCQKYSDLKYPNSALYTAFAVVEHVYASMAKAEKFEIFCGSLLWDVIKGMLENIKIKVLLHGLYGTKVFSKDIILRTVKNYMDVLVMCKAKMLLIGSTATL